MDEEIEFSEEDRTTLNSILDSLYESHEEVVFSRGCPSSALERALKRRQKDERELRVFICRMIRLQGARLASSGKVR